MKAERVGLTQETIAILGLAALGLILFGFTRADIDSLRQEMRQELNGVRQEMRQEIGGVRQEMRQEIGGVRQEMRQEIGGVRQEIGGVRQEIGGVRREIAMLGERLARVEVILGIDAPSRPEPVDAVAETPGLPRGSEAVPPPDSSGEALARN